MAHQVGGTYVEIRARYDKLKQDLAVAKNETKTAGDYMAGAMNKMALALAGAFSVNAIKNFAVEVWNATKAFEATTKAFEQITGSAAATNREFEFLRDLAKRTGQNFYDLANTYKGFLAASKGTNLEGEKTRYIFQAIVKASASLGLSSDEVSGSLYAVQQMMSKGTVNAEELRQQLGERLPGAYNLMAEAIGVSAGELQKMLERGEVLADEALPKLAALLEKRYPGSVAEAVAATNRLTQAWNDLKVAIGQGYMGDAITTSMGALATYLEWYKEQIDQFSFQKIIDEKENLTEQIAALNGELGGSVQWWQLFYGSNQAGQERLKELEDQLLKINLRLIESEGYVDSWARGMASAADSTAKAYVDSWQYADKEREAAFERGAEEWSKAVDAEIAEAKRAAEEQAAIREDFSKKYQETILDDYDYAVLMLNQEVEKFSAAGADKERLAEYYTTRLGELQNQYLTVVEGSNNAQYESELTKWQLIDQASMAGVEEAIARHNAMTGEVEASAAEQADAYRKLYDDLGQVTQESYLFKVGLLDQEYEKLKQVLGDSELLQAAYAERKKELDWEMRLSGDDFLDGMLVAWEQYEDQKKTLAEQGAQFFADTHAAMRDTASDIFFDALTGDLKDLGDYAEAIWQSIARSFADMAAQMVADYAMSGLMDLLKPSSSGGGLVAGIVGALGSLGGTIGGVADDAWSFVTDLFGFDAGAWMVEQDQLAQLHTGEMVVPADMADYFRSLIEASGSAVSWQQGYAGPTATGTGEAGWAARQYYENMLATYQAGFGGPDIAGMVDPAVGGGDASAFWAAYNAGYFDPSGIAGGGISYSGFGAGGATSGLTGAMSADAMRTFGSGLLVGLVRSYNPMTGDVNPAAAIFSGLMSVAAGQVNDAFSVVTDKNIDTLSSVLSSGAGYFGGPIPGIAAKLFGDVAANAILDAVNGRQLEGIRDALESAVGASAFASFASGMGEAGWSSEGVLGWGGYGDLGIGNPASYGGSYTSDTYGGADIYARGGWAVGPTSGYSATLHGTEYVLNQDQIKAIRDLAGGGGRGAVVKIIVDGQELGRMIRTEADGIQVKREIREIRGRRNTTGASPARLT